MNDSNKSLKYLLHPDGITGYCFDEEKREVRKRYNGVESIVQPYSKEMGRANDVLAGMTLGFGVGEKGDVITEEEYKKL